MSVIRTDHFTAALQKNDWVASQNDASICMKWHMSNKDRRGNVPVATYGGALWCSNRRLGQGNLCYWELTKTWEQLGVPSGSTILTVKGDYAYRFGQQMRNHTNCYSPNATATQAGPFSLHNSAGTLIHTFSMANYCPAGYIGTGYPAGLRYAAITDVRADWLYCTVPAITEVNPSIAPSSTQVKFRIYCCVPDCPDYPSRGIAKNMTVKIDRIVITITYQTTIISPTMQGVSTIQGISTVTF